MQLILYPFILFVIIFLLQIFFIIRKEKKNKNKSNLKIVIKILMALILAIIVAVIFFYALGIWALVGLREGH